MTVDTSINVGNVIVLLTTLVLITIAYVRGTERSRQNREELTELRAHTKSEIDRLERKHDKESAQLLDSINALGIEVRAMHAENSRHRETVARDYVSSASLRGPLDIMQQQLSNIQDRLDRMIDGRRDD